MFAINASSFANVAFGLMHVYTFLLCDMVIRHKVESGVARSREKSPNRAICKRVTQEDDNMEVNTH